MNEELPSLVSDMEMLAKARCAGSQQP